MRNTRKRRPRRSPAQWELLVKVWRESTETNEEFCARHDINESTLYRWHTRLGGDEQAESPEEALRPAAFLPVRVVDSSEQPRESLSASAPSSPPESTGSASRDSQGHLEVVAANGRIVRIWGEVAEGALSRVLTVVEQC